MSGLNSLIVGFFLVLVPLSNASASPAGPSITVNIHSAEKFKKDDLKTLNSAKQYIEVALNSEAFRNRVLDFTYQGQKQFVQNNGMSNEQIYEYLMTGAEKLPNPTSTDHVMDLRLALYTPGIFENRHVIGYTSATDPVIHINRKIFRDSDVNEIADNLVHEWTHKMGFEHDFDVTDRRPYSVPYAVGYIIDDLVQELAQ